MTVSFLSGFGALLTRDLKLAFRQRADLVNPLLFFVIVVSLFPLGVGADKTMLRTIAPGVIWVAALLAVMTSLDRLFRQDLEDGSLEQLLLSPQPLFLLVLAKVLAHWLVTGLPLVVLSPLLGVMLFVEEGELWVLVVSLLLGTPVLSMIGAVGAGLTVSLKQAGFLVAILVLPLYVPVLIFGAGAVYGVMAGLVVTGQLAMLGALLALAFTLAPFAVAAGLRITAGDG